MKRIHDEFLKKLTEVLALSGKDVLEIGCGGGTRSLEIAAVCQSLTGIDPSEADISEARNRGITNTKFALGTADNLEFPDNSFDVVIYTLSFHHVPKELMQVSIDEALRVLKPQGSIVFFEPGMEGSLFEAEIIFDAYDGDEREVKALAYEAMFFHPGLFLVVEIGDESIFQFDSLEDFLESMSPKQSLADIESFLVQHNYTLNAERRINVFSAR